MRKYYYFVVVLVLCFAGSARAAEQQSGYPKALWVSNFSGYGAEEMAKQESKSRPEQPMKISGIYYFNGAEVTKEYLLANHLIKSDEEITKEQQTKDTVNYFYWGLFFIALMLTVIACFQAYSGKVIFFDSFLDAFLNVSPIFIILWGVTVEKNVILYAGLGLGVLYSFAQAYRCNPQGGVMIPILAVARFVVGIFLPLVWIFLILNRTRSSKLQGETVAEYQARLALERAAGSAFMMGLMGTWLFLMKTLINGEMVRENRLGLAGESVSPDIGERVIPAASSSGKKVSSKNKKQGSDKLAKLKDEFASADIRPQPADVSVAAWLYRIGQWGKMNLTHIDQESGRKEKFSTEQLLSLTENTSLTEVRGQWEIFRLDINKAEMVREYMGGNGAKYQEKVLIDIDLDPDLKESLKA